ncbi:MAG: exodeoxyribonuclease VII large subunit [bacterium]|nr:exodeoxyribonuclease VII large subunit [bacterium]
MLESPLSITDVTLYINDLFQTDDRLQSVWVMGEVSNMKRAASGHCYFTLKDGAAELTCVLFRSDAQRQSLIPRDGDSVVAHGAIKVYVQRGSYQLYVDRVRPVGVGDLYAQFEQLKAKLESEGLFDPERKRPLPSFPRTIGVVTSADAAAFQDVLNVLRRRFPLVQVLLAPTLVQGSDAPPLIRRAIQAIDARDDIDVILICRGGGSLEDLWAFNDEGVARAIAAARHPVISGVGHETDFTIADFVADLRAPTPSAAAELLTPDIEDLRYHVARMRRQLADAVTAAVGRKRSALDDERRALRNASPLVSIRALRQRIDEYTGRMTRAERAHLHLMRANLRGKMAALSAASPDAILKRGYVMVRRTDGTNRADGTERVNSAAALRPGERVRLHFHDGERGATID